MSITPSPRHLKRLSQPIGLDEISQIKKYANKVSKNKYFDKEKAKWNFIVVGTRLTDDAKEECKQVDRPYGLVTNGQNIKVWIKEWNQIIQESKGKLKYLQAKLEYSVSGNSEGIDYLRGKYPQYIPD